MYLVGLPYAVQGDPYGAHHGVPDQPFIPHLNCEAQIQAVYFTVRQTEGEGGGGGEKKRMC